MHQTQGGCVFDIHSYLLCYIHYYNAGCGHETVFCKRCCRSKEHEMGPRIESCVCVFGLEG